MEIGSVFERLRLLHKATLQSHNNCLLRRPGVSDSPCLQLQQLFQQFVVSADVFLIYFSVAAAAYQRWVSLMWAVGEGTPSQGAKQEGEQG